LVTDTEYTDEGITIAKYGVNDGYYYVKTEDFAGLESPASNTVSIKTNYAEKGTGDPGSNGESSSDKPTKFYLYNNHPNPFNPFTELIFSVPQQSYVKVEIYNLLGIKIIALHDGIKQTGTYRIMWNGLDETGIQLPAGIYICRMTAGDYIKSIKMVLVR